MGLCPHRFCPFPKMAGESEYCQVADGLWPFQYSIALQQRFLYLPGIYRRLSVLVWTPFVHVVRCFYSATPRQHRKGIPFAALASASHPSDRL